MSGHFAELKAETKPGLCIFCDEPLPPPKGGRTRISCGSVLCKRMYWKLWRAENKAERCVLCGEPLHVPHKRGCAVLGAEA